MSHFVKESEEYILMKFTPEEIEKICNILNHLILTENQEEIFTHHDIETIANANKYTNLFFTYALRVSEDIQTHQGELVGGGVINATSFFILLLLLFNTVLVDAGILSKRTALHLKPLKTIIYPGMSQKIISQNTIKLSETVIELSSNLHKYTPPLLKDVIGITTMTTHTAKLTTIIILYKNQVNEVCKYIIDNILLRKIESKLKSTVTSFVHTCFIKEIVPLFFPELKEISVQFADIILWCIQNKIPETFVWSKKIKTEIIDFYKPQLEYMNYWGGRKTIKEKKRSFICSKKNIKHRKKNTKITMKKTMMNRMMLPK
jgi:hypothetical protein